MAPDPDRQSGCYLGASRDRPPALAPGGEVAFEGVTVSSPEHADIALAKVRAYVRPYDFEVIRYSPQISGIPVRLDRAIVFGPIARLELNIIRSPDFSTFSPDPLM